MADNNCDAANRFALLLGLVGHDLQVACAGSEALAAYMRPQPQLALLDMRMPKHSSAKLTQLVRRQQRAPIALVAVASLGRQQDGKRALQAGFDERMIKPIDHPQLQALVDTA